MAVYRKTLAQMEEEAPWTAAEWRLIDKARTGRVVLGETLPKTASDDVAIRGELIRHMVLGGCEEMHVAAGRVVVVGARITGRLDLNGCETPHDLCLHTCAFEESPFMRDSVLGGVYLPGCEVPGLNAHRMRVAGGVLLVKGFKATEIVDLSSARIDGVLQCSGGSFSSATGLAFDANSIVVGDSVFLNDDFSATGEVSFVGAKVRGQLACVDGRFENCDGSALSADGIDVGSDVFLSDGFSAAGEVRLLGARIEGLLSCIDGRFENSNGPALNADGIVVGATAFLREGFTAKGAVVFLRANITGSLQCRGAVFHEGFDCEAMTVGAGFFWRDVEDFSGALNLTVAKVGTLVDDADSWAKVSAAALGGFCYDTLNGNLSVAQRLGWLAKKAEAVITPKVGEDVEVKGRRLRIPLPFLRLSNTKDFDPQPYTQLAKVYRDQGAPMSAARVLEIRERKLLDASRRRAQAQLDGTWDAGWRSLVAELKRPVNWLFGVMFGYGHRPGKALIWVALIIGPNWALYAQAWQTRQMAPESDVVLTSAAWIQAAEDAGPDGHPLAAWVDTPEAQDYTTFNAFLYALDLFIPLDALGQEIAWSPSPVRGLWGWLGFWTGWLTQLSGWIITAVSAAAVTGLVGRRD